MKLLTAPICAPTPTLSPTLIVLTSLPTLMARPITSWPTQRGRGTSPQPPVMEWRSLAQTPILGKSQCCKQDDRLSRIRVAKWTEQERRPQCNEYVPQASIAISISRSSNCLSLNCGKCQRLPQSGSEEAASLVWDASYLFLLEGGPLLGVVDHKSLCGLWVRHVCGDFNG